MEEKIYKSAEIAEALGVSQRTIQNWVTEGKLLGRFVGDRKKKLMISESDLKRFLEKNPRYKEIWHDPMMRQAPHDIRVYIQEKLQILRELHIVLTTNQTVYLWSLRREFDIDAFVHDVITGKTSVK